MIKIKVCLENADIKDYYELNKILIRRNVETKIINKKSDGNELGLSFEELIILLPLLTPITVEISKIIIAYFDYKKSQNKKINIIIEKNNKKFRLESENSKTPTIDEICAFLDED